jgi:FAD binding domain-containing protein/berberine-like enzyme
MQQTQVLIDDAAVQELGATFGGALLRPEDDGYDEARAIFNGMYDRRPALVARCTGVADVVAAVNFARDSGLEVAVKAGGHSVPGYGSCDDGIVIDLSPMKGVFVDPAARTARAAGGVTWGEFDRETQAFGLATTGGRITTTGIAGLTLGSGSGWLERKFGFTVDNLLSAQVVTAAGEVITASETENPELFWGLRGGGGNFGIVTSFEYRLHPLGPIVLGGLLGYPRERAPELLRAWSDHIQDAPDELGGGFAFLTAPPEEFVPEEVRGQPVCGVVVLYAGPLEEAEPAVQQLRDLLGPPAMDLAMPMPYLVVQQLLDGANPPGRPQYWKSDTLEEMSDGAIETLIEHANRIASPFTVVVIEAKGGAIPRVPEDSMALIGRHAPFAYYGISQWEQGDAADGQIRWAREFGQAMEPYSAKDIALNFVMDEGNERVQAAFGPDKYARLVALKDEYDPENLFSRNQNVKPSGRG